MEIVDKLVSLIASGQYNAYDKLPSENEIADQYKVPRNTARKAYERLEELGYMYKKQGKGSYVKDRYKQIELVLSGMALLELNKVTKKYNDDCCALEDVSFSVDEGEFVSIIGPSGAGSRHFCAVLTGSLKRTAGKSPLMAFFLQVLARISYVR